jgi:hypothetical protein
VEQLEAQGHEFRTAPVSEESEVADAHEAGRQDMQQEASQELVCVERKQSLLILVRRISPPKGDAPVRDRHNAVVGDGDAMGVAAEIAQRVFGSAERAL